MCVLLFSEAEGMVEYDEFGQFVTPCLLQAGQDSPASTEVPHVFLASTHPQWEPSFCPGLLDLLFWNFS